MYRLNASSPCLSGVIYLMRLVASLFLVGFAFSTTNTLASAKFPARLSDTGLFVDAAQRVASPDVIAFEPAFALWSDGSAKRRWIFLPRGGGIDASNPEAWKFPRGTKLWKEFSHGTRVETRYIELARNGEWRFATYVWDEQGRDALLAPEKGLSRLEWCQMHRRTSIRFHPKRLPHLSRRSRLYAALSVPPQP
jgi:hypothetical protein